MNSRRLPTKRRISAIVLVATALVLGIAQAVLFAIGRPVHGHSMDPTLRPGQRVVVTSVGTMTRGDVVVFNPPGADVLAIKRVIGLPGDRIQIQAQGSGQQILVQPAGSSSWFYVARTAKGAPRNDGCCMAAAANNKFSFTSPVLVPPGQYFLMGDNLPVSDDSRTYGFVERSRITGRAAMRAWPPGKLSTGLVLEPAGVM